MAHPQYMSHGAAGQPPPAPQQHPQQQPPPQQHSSQYIMPPNPNYPAASAPLSQPSYNSSPYPYSPAPGAHPPPGQPGQMPGQPPGPVSPGMSQPLPTAAAHYAQPPHQHQQHAHQHTAPPGGLPPAAQYSAYPGYSQFYSASQPMPATSAIPGMPPGQSPMPGGYGMPTNGAPPTPGGMPGVGVGAQFINSPFATASTIPNHIMAPPGAQGMLPGHHHQPGLNGMPSMMSTQPHLATNASYPAQNTRTITQPPEIKLEIMAKHLWDRDTVSKSDPTCVVFMEDRRGNMHNFSVGYDMANMDTDDVQSGDNGPQRSSIRWKEVGRTECLKNNLNPHFKVQITVPYVFEQLQHIKFGLWDIDSKKQTDLDSHDFLGEARTTVGELVMSGAWTSTLVSPNAKDMKNILGGKRDLGTITVIVHETRDAGNVLIKANLSGRKLDRKDFGISSDPYFIVTQMGSRAPTTQNGTAKRTPISRSQLYESEVIKRNVNPTWKPFHVRVAKPKGGSNADILVEFLVNDKDNHSRDDEIGKVTLSVDELEKTSEIPLTNGKRRLLSKNKPKICGYLRFSNVRVIPMPSLVDYLQGGLKLHFSVAVDLTASNGNPNEPLSLHYCQDFLQGNQYTRALTAIASVLHVYAPPDQLFAAFGFGAVLPGAPGYTNSCFPLSLRPDPMCHGLHGILEAYVVALRTVKLSGPTNFAPLIDTVSRTAAQRLNTQTDQNYDILLILTDGVVSDFDLTVDQIISASHKAPLSIIIIGIGNRNFEKMKDLDSDGKLLTSADGQRQAARDICQFVAFNDHEGQSPERLGAAVLAEVPGNIVEYFAGICNPPINPGRRPAANIISQR